MKTICYSEFPNIRIPGFLQGDRWEDSSYGNDETASSMLKMPEDFKYELRVWVQPARAADRENPESSKYSVVVYDGPSSNAEILEEVNVETAREAEAWAKKFIGQLDLLLDLHIMNQKVK